MLDRYTFRTLILEIVMIVVALIFMAPIYILIINALRPESDQSTALSFPAAPTFDNFVTAWQTANLGAAMINSLVVTIVSVFVIAFIGSLAAYPLARLTSGWSKAAYYGFMAGLILPFQLGLIPLYQTMRDIGQIGSLSSLVIIYAGIQTPLAIFLFTEFLRSVPADYEEAASLDGAGRWGTYWHVVLPMVRPITGTVVVLNAVLIWNDFYVPLLYLGGSGNATLPVAVFQFTGQYSSQWGLIFSSLIIGCIPIVAAFLIMQRAVFRGYATGIKG
jgi:raffinose/stachyose/melibiose transport system permease protein